MYITLFGDRRGTLPAGWIRETIVALLGDARIDATGPAGRGATMTFLGLAGDAVVRVPPGSRVTGGGLSVFGTARSRSRRATGLRSASTGTACSAT
jgi:hypothetical protein